MYAIHLFVLLNILGVMIDNKRFVIVFFVVRVTLVPVSYLSAPSAVHIATGYQESLFVGWKVYSYSTKSLFV